MTQAVVPLDLPPIDAFLITPQFVSSDLWVWPLYLVFAFFWIRRIHRAAGVSGRDIDLLVGLKTVNGLVLWGTIIALSSAVHRVTDDVIVSGLWTGMTLGLWTLLYRAILKFSPLAPANERATAAYARYKEELNAKSKAEKQATPPVKVFAEGLDRPDPAAEPAPEPVRTPAAYYVGRDTPADARRQVAVLMRKELFADPPPPPEPEKPPVA